MMSPKLEAALDAAGRGFRVFPLWRDSKIPWREGWQTAATTDVDRICEWWAENPQYNVGIATGSGLLVVDVDTKNGKQGAESLAMLEMMGLPDTLRVRTPTGGLHVYLRTNRQHSGRTGNIKDLPGLDTRGDGNLVVWAGSYIGRNKYEVLHEKDLAPCPDWLFETIEAKAGPRSARIETFTIEPDQPRNIERAVSWLRERAPEAIDGANGDQTTYSVAAELRAMGLSEGAAFEAMAEHWNEQKAVPPWSPDELAKKVSNGYRYGQGAFGGKTAAGEFDHLEIDIGASPFAKAATKERVSDKKNKLASVLFSIDEAEARLTRMDREPLIEGVMHRGTLVTLIGPQKSGKTFNIIDICSHVATGRPWCGRAVAQGVALHIICEGEGGVPARLNAIRRAKNIPEGTPHYVAPMRVDLFNSAEDAKAVISLIRSLEQRHGLPVQIVAVDTLARAMPGGDENTTKDLAKVIGHIDMIREQTKAAFLLAHHTGWHDKSRSRGGSALPGAIDAEMLLDSGKIVFQNMRDFEEPEAIPYRLEEAYAGTDAHGRDVYSAVVRYLSDGEFEILTEAEEAYRDALGEALSAAGAEAVTSAVWDETYRKTIDPSWEKDAPPPKGCSEQQLRRMRKNLVDGRHVVRVKQRFTLQ